MPADGNLTVPPIEQQIEDIFEPPRNYVQIYGKQGTLIGAYSDTLVFEADNWVTLHLKADEEEDKPARIVKLNRDTVSYFVINDRK